MYPRSPNDTNKIYESLQNMDVQNIPLPEDIDKEQTR